MKTLALTITAVLLFLNVQSQTRLDNTVRTHLFEYRLEKIIDFNGIDITKLKYTGSPYLNEEFLPGEIYHKNKLIADKIPIRYNALMDEMEFKTSFEIPDEESSALLKSLDIDVRIMNQVFTFVPYQGGVEKGGYFEVLHQDQKHDLFKKYKKKYTPEKKAETSITRDVPAKFTDYPVYYLVRPDGKFIELPSKNRKFADAFIGKEKEINQYRKDNKLNIGDEKDLIRIVKYYNSLL